MSNPEAYVFTVAANLAREHAVLSGRLAQSVPHDAPEIEPDLAFSPAIDDEIDNETRAVRLREVLEQLSPKCRTAVILHYREGLSYAETAARLGVSTNMVKKYLVSALGPLPQAHGPFEVIP